MKRDRTHKRPVPFRKVLLNLSLPYLADSIALGSRSPRWSGTEPTEFNGKVFSSPSYSEEFRIENVPIIDRSCPCPLFPCKLRTGVPESLPPAIRPSCSRVNFGSCRESAGGFAEDRGTWIGIGILRPRSKSWVSPRLCSKGIVKDDSIKFDAGRSVQV